MGNRYEKFAKELSALGYDVTPLAGKRPILKAWQQRPAEALDFKAHGDANIGVLTGGDHSIIAIDIDVKDAPASQAIIELVTDRLGFAPQRIGAAPKTLFVFRCTESFRKTKTAIYEIAGQDACVEVLAEGQQFVASGKHPDTGTNYSWPDDSLIDVPPTKLTAITPNEIAGFIAAANNTLAGFGAIKSRSMSEGGGVTGKFDFAESPQKASLEKIEHAVMFIPNNDVHYDDWVYTAHAIKGAVGEDGFDLFDRWSKRSAKYDTNETTRLWKSIGDVKTIGAGTLIHTAKQYGYTAPDENFGPSSLKDDEPVEDDEWTTDTPDADDGSFTAASVVGPVPEREWALDQWFPYKTVGMLFGAGGIGKTLIAHQLANCVATGRDFFGIAVKQMPVLCILCEDDSLEIKRRQLDINQWAGLTEFDTGPENLTLWPRIGDDNILVTFPSQGEAKSGSFFEKLCKKIEHTKGDNDNILVILDTAADLYGGSENTRREVNTFIKTYLGALVNKYNATVIVLAHPSLTGLSTGSGLSGSTAWENSVRSRAYLERSKDTEELLILSRKKSNYSAIGANTDITLIWENGVLVVPSSPDQIDRINQTKLKGEILTEIEAAWCDGVPYKSNKSSSRKIGLALPEKLNHHKTTAVKKAIIDLENGGYIVHIERKGYRVERWLP